VPQARTNLASSNDEAVRVFDSQSQSAVSTELPAGDKLIHAGSAAVLLLWLYTGFLLGWLLLRWWQDDRSELNAAAISIPAQLATAALIGHLLYARKLERLRMIGWSMLLVGILIDVPAIVVWSWLNQSAEMPLGSLADALYLLNYVAQGGCLAMLFVSCGGSFRRPRLWTDAAALIVCAGAALLPFLVTPVLAPAGVFKPSVPGSMVYLVGIGACGTMALLLFMQIVDWQRERATLLVLAGCCIGLVTDVIGIASNVRGQFDLRNFDDFFYCLVYAVIGTGVFFEWRRESQPRSAANTDGNLYGFLPVLCILLSIVIVLGAEARRSSVNILTAALLLCIGSALVVARQWTARREVRRLQEALMSRTVESRLNELVRQSGDLIVVLTASGTISYASPAAERLLGRPAERLLASMGTALLGIANQERLAGLLAGFTPANVHTGNITRAAEFIVELTPSLQRAVQVSVSKQRATEREVLLAVNQERQRLGSELHEGLGQTLTGIYLLAQNMRTALHRGHDDMPQLIEQAIAHARNAIDDTRSLARDFSPVQVARGSLGAALQQLAVDAGQRLQIQVLFESELADDRMPDSAADHLHRIAYEALTNAARHGRCRKALIKLWHESNQMLLSVSDDGVGFLPERRGSEGLGVKMMDYRARVLGGSLKFERPSSGGTRLVAAIPMHSIVPGTIN
jgi:signal transduction histidine kinase